jgi:hypothetical protein
MKYILIPFLLGLVLFSCEPNVSVDNTPKKEGLSKADIIRMPVSANPQVDTTLVAKMTFEETVHEFGTVLEGKQVEHVFKFKNTGKVPLLISDSKTTCGCTVPNFPKDPIAPGESGEVSVKFNTAGKKKEQNKPISLIANTYPARTVIYMQGYVQPNAEFQKAIENQKQ